MESYLCSCVSVPITSMLKSTLKKCNTNSINPKRARTRCWVKGDEWLMQPLRAQGKGGMDDHISISPPSNVDMSDQYQTLGRVWSLGWTNE